MNEDGASRFAQLTPREWAVFPLVARGMSDYEVASALHLATGTTRTHIRELRRKLNVSSRRDLARLFERIETVVGVVKAWHGDMGILTSPNVPGEVFTGAGDLEGTERELGPGDPVEFRYAPLPPAGRYPYQAIWVRKL